MVGGWQGKNEFVADTTSFLPGTVGVTSGGRVGKGKNELVSDTNSVLPESGYRGHFGSRYTLGPDKNIDKNSQATLTSQLEKFGGNG